MLLACRLLLVCAIIAVSATPEGFVEDDPIFNFVERVWTAPCVEHMPRPMQGLCLYFPMMAIGMSLVGVVALLAWCDGRKPKKQPVPASAQGPKTKKAKKAD